MDTNGFSAALKSHAVGPRWAGQLQEAAVRAPEPTRKAAVKDSIDRG